MAPSVPVGRKPFEHDAPERKTQIPVISQTVSTTKVRPPPLIPERTFIYKTVPSRERSEFCRLPISAIPIKVDVFIPSNTSPEKPYPVLLFIHGGGWIHSNRSDYGRTWFQRFLAKGYVVCSMDYRFLPESTFEEQCSDVRDMEAWIHTELQQKLEGEGIEVKIDKGRIIVAGASAGAHLALLTPKLWDSPPRAILSLYGPTNFHNIPYLHRGNFTPAVYPIPDCTHALLAQATQYENPPTEFPIPETAEDRKHARHYMGQHIYRGEILTDFLLRALRSDGEIVDGEGKCLRLPDRRKDDITEEEIDMISPLHLLRKGIVERYPPVYQMLGTNDWLFEMTQMTEFAAELQNRGIDNEMKKIDGGEHGFDIYCTLGDDNDISLIHPAVEWLCLRCL